MRIDVESDVTEVVVRSFELTAHVSTGSATGDTIVDAVPVPDGDVTETVTVCWYPAAKDHGANTTALPYEVALAGRAEPFTVHATVNDCCCCHDVPLALMTAYRAIGVPASWFERETICTTGIGAGTMVSCWLADAPP